MSIDHRYQPWLRSAEPTSKRTTLFMNHLTYQIKMVRLAIWEDALLLVFQRDTTCQRRNIPYVTSDCRKANNNQRLHQNEEVENE